MATNSSVRSKNSEWSARLSMYEGHLTEGSGGYVSSICFLVNAHTQIWKPLVRPAKSSQVKFYLCIISAWLPTDDVNVGSDLSGTFMAEMCKHHRSRHMTLRDTWAWIHITAAADFCEEVQDPVAYKILTRRRVIARAMRTCNWLPCLTIHNPAVWSQRIIIKNNI